MNKDLDNKISPEEIVEELSRKLRGQNLDGWEIYLQREEGISIEARDARLESLESQSTLALALRLIKSGRLGFGYSSDFRPESMARLLAEIIAHAQEADPDPFLVLPGPEGSSPAPLDIFDPAFREVAEREKIKRAMDMERAALDSDPRIKRVRGCEYNESLDEVWIANSRGLRRGSAATRFSATINAVAEQDGEAQIAGEFDWSFRYSKLFPEMVGKSVAQKAIAKLGGKPLASRKVPVIFSSEVAGPFMDLLSFALNGESLSKGKTWLRGSEGKKIFSDRVTVIDDNRFSAGPLCFPFDDEGVGSRKKIVVDAGVVRQFIFDSYYGNKMKTASTANARREQIAMPPSVGPSNFYLAPGLKSPDELRAGLNAGMVVEEVLGMHMADEITGDFSVGVSGHLVNKGKIDAPVSGVAIAGNLKDLFAKVSETGADLKFYSNCASPSVLIDELEISGS